MTVDVVSQHSIVTFQGDPCDSFYGTYLQFFFSLFDGEEDDPLVVIVAMSFGLNSIIIRKCIDLWIN
jgi:hypothetical protein